MTAAQKFLKSALTRKARIAELNDEIRDERDGLQLDIYEMSQAGMTGAEISRALGLSETHVRNSIMKQALLNQAHERGGKSA